MGLELLVQEPLLQPSHPPFQPTFVLFLGRQRLLRRLPLRRRWRGPLIHTLLYVLLLMAPSALATHRNGEQHRVARVHLPALIVSALRLHVVVRESVPFPIQIDLVHQPSVVVRRVLLVKCTRIGRMLFGRQESGSDEPGRQAGDDGVAGRGRAGGEGTAVAAQDVRAAGFVEDLVSDDELALGVDAPFEDTGAGLRVDLHARLGAVLLPHLVDEGFVVAVEIRSDRVAMSGVEDTEIPPVRVLHYELIPRSFVRVRLLAKTGGQSVQAVGRRAHDVLGLPGRLLQGDGDGEAGHEVDVADVRVQLRVVERELAEAEVHVRVRVAGVEHARLDQCRAGVE